jgi:hypothetical protein
MINKTLTARLKCSSAARPEIVMAIHRDDWRKRDGRDRHLRASWNAGRADLDVSRQHDFGTEEGK